MEIAEFLLARLAEDEAGARAVMDQGDFPSYPHGLHSDELDYCARWNPARVLAECEAKRRIVELHADTHECSCFIGRGQIDNYTLAIGGDCSTMRLLALPFADHPNYDPEWKV